MSEQQRPRLTERAARLLEEFKKQVTFKIIHEAEKNTLKENRGEISEADIQKAQRIIPKISDSKRRWLIRIGMAVIFVLLLSHFEIYSQITNISLILQIRLYIPTIASLIWIVSCTYLFRDDWL